MIYKEYKDYIKHKAHSLLTPGDIEGPFYKPNAPFLENGRMVDYPTLILTGKVMSVAGQLLTSIILDFWQANIHGEYDNAGFNLRGKVVTDTEGRYRLETVRPGNYKIDDDEHRCAHIHVKITGSKILTTQLYFSDDPYNVTDRWFDPRRTIKMDGMNGTFDFTIE